jgi:hypothetical protein
MEYQFANNFKEELAHIVWKKYEEKCNEGTKDCTVDWVLVFALLFFP